MNDDNKNELEKITSIHQAALKLSEAGENQRALELLRYALELDLDFASTHVLLGLTYQSLNQLKEAEEHFFKAVALDPKNSEALQSLGLFLVANDRTTEGVEWLQKYVERGNWSNQEIIEKLIALLGKMGQSDEALSLLRKAWLKSRKSEIGRLYARYLEDKGNRDDAYWAWKIVAMQPKVSSDFFEIGADLLLENRNEEAIQYLEIAVALNDYMSLAEPGFSYEEYEAAGDMWPYANEDDPGELSLYYWLIANAYLELNNGEKALEVIEHKMWTVGAGPDEYLTRAEALILLERYNEAIQDIDKGLEQVKANKLSADWGEGLYKTKAIALSKLDKYQEALETLKKGIQRYPESLILNSSAFSQMMLLGDFPNAAHLFEKAIRKGVDIQTPDYSSMYIRCLAFSGRENIPEAIKEGLIKGKNEEEAYFFIYNIFDALQDYPTICGDYLRFLVKRFPNSTFFYNLQGLVLANQGGLRKAEKILLKILDKTHSKLEEQVIQNNLGYIYLLRGKPKKAEECFRRVIDIDASGDNEGYPAILEVAYYWAGEIISDYLPIASRVIDPKSAAHANLATLALSQGDTDVAGKHAIQVLSLQPENNLGYEALAFTFLARGDRQAALEALDKALDRIGEVEAPLIALSLMREKIELKLAEKLPEI